MKIYKNLYWSIISPQALLRAWEIFKSDKRNKPDVAIFESGIEQNIFALYMDLKNGTYRHGPYKGFWIHDPKLRRIHKATVCDRVLHHAIFSVLNRIFEPTFINDSYSCRIDKGTHKGMKKVANMVRSVSQNYTRPCYALKCDIRKFFDTVDHSILISTLQEKIKDSKTMRLIEEVIGSYASDENVFTRERERERATQPLFKKGIPIGNLTSQIFANIYMDRFDQFVKHELKVKNYVRYTDDFVIIANDDEYLRGILKLIKDFLKINLCLELHPKKVTIRKYNQGIDFLGYIILPYHIKLRTKTKHRMIRRLCERVIKYKNGEITEDNFQASMKSYLGVMSHANAYELSQEILNMCWFLFTS